MKTRKFTIHTILAGSALLASSLVSAQSTSPATIPTSFLGTYDLTYANAQPNSPLPNGTEATMVLAPGGLLCIADYILTSPVLENGNPAEAIWSAASAGVKLAVSNINTGTFNEVNVATMSNVWLGQLQGSKVSNSTDCGDSDLPDIDQVAEVFELAEEQYSQYFPASISKTFQILDGHMYRYYPSTGIHLSISNDGVFVKGGEFGGNPVSVGTLAAVLAELTGQDPIDVDPDIDIPEGDFDLTISGTVQAIVFGFAGPAVPFNVTIENLPAPDANDIDATEDAIREAMKDAGTINSLIVTTVSVSSSRVIFDVRFSGTIQSAAGPVTSNYVLRYDYVRN